MATSPFLSRWSKRKLEEASEQNEEQPPCEKLNVIDEGHGAGKIEARAVTQGQETEATQTIDEKRPDEMSIANLLVSEASDTVKKAALRKLFLSEEFNVRDGLDDYDDDYSNLKSLSEGVAETLRDWVKENTEVEPLEDVQPVHGPRDPMIAQESNPEQESTEIPDNQGEVLKHEATDQHDILALNAEPQQIGQNIPHPK